MKYLVLVESPAKCSKIEKYLNNNDDLNIYEVMATMGHITELKSLKNINIENNFSCSYELINSKKKNTDLIKKKIKTVDEVILACDNDREGESINYYICDTFGLPITTKRIVFNEITETAIKQAINNPRTIDMNIVHAQQARQILDILVGFKVTPMLWKFITQKAENSLSAGRCQTPALKIIYDNKCDIDNLEEKQIYNTCGYFTNNNVCFELNKQFDTKKEICDFLNGSVSFAHKYSCSQPNKIFKQPPEPFTTSKIQQTASNELRYSPKETMLLCQKLYEAGYITYMRTDSKKYSTEFIDSAKEYIIRTFTNGEKYVNENIYLLVNSQKPNEKPNEKPKKKNTPEVNIQEAHEAIRPTNVSLKELPETINSKERKMYKLIWENTLESCMSPAIFYYITASIAGFNNTTFTYTSELNCFLGWKIVKNKISTENKEYHYLQTIKQDTIPYKKICSRISLKNTKQHYTEARLVHLLEEKGIGRPSTFSMLVDKIQERGYVKKEDIKGKQIVCNDYELTDGKILEIESIREFGNEKSKLVMQPLGIIVMEFLEKYFLDIFNYDYTKNMEDTLDKISKGESTLLELCSGCNQQLDQLINNLKDETKIEIKIDENNTYVIGKYGPVIKCSDNIDGKDSISFKSIKKEVDISKIKKGEYNLDEIVDNSTKQKSQYILGKYEDNDVILRKGKFGLYITWGENSKTLKDLGNRPMENVTFEEIEKHLDSGCSLIREIKSGVTIRKGAKGDYIFYKPPKLKKPKFFDIKSFYAETKEDYKICNLTILKTWIKEKYDI